jgi:hypothetical protein
MNKHGHTTYTLITHFLYFLQYLYVDGDGALPQLFGTAKGIFGLEIVFSRIFFDGSGKGSEKYGRLVLANLGK